MRDLARRAQRAHHDRRRLQTLVLEYLRAEARATDPGHGTTVFEVELTDVTSALRPTTHVCERCARRALEDLVGPESILPFGPPCLDVLPCDGLPAAYRYRVLFVGDPGALSRSGCL